MGSTLKEVSALKTPITATKDDVMLYGHGDLAAVGETTVPAGFEVYVFLPPGGLLLSTISEVLAGGKKIKTLGVKMLTGPDGKAKSGFSGKPWTDFLNGGDWSPCAPTIYAAGKKIPDFTLHPPTGLPDLSKSPVPKLIQVTAKSKLSALWSQLTPVKGKTVRVFWSACSAIATGILDDKGKPITGTPAQAVVWCITG